MKVNFKKEEQSVNFFIAEIPNPPSFFKVKEKTKVLGNWKTKVVKKYLTANLWYGSTGSKQEGVMRSKIKKKIMLYLQAYFSNCPRFKDFPIKIDYEYFDSKAKFDLHNKLFFWAKLIEDYMVNTNRIPDDNVKYINEETYKYIESNECKLVIKIKVNE